VKKVAVCNASKRILPFLFASFLQTAKVSGGFGGVRDGWGWLIALPPRSSVPSCYEYVFVSTIRPGTSV
jgi:hypothetical protein